MTQIASYLNSREENLVSRLEHLQPQLQVKVLWYGKIVFRMEENDKGMTLQKIIDFSRGEVHSVPARSKNSHPYDDLVHRIKNIEGLGKKQVKKKKFIVRIACKLYQWINPPTYTDLQDEIARSSLSTAAEKLLFDRLNR